MFIEHLLSPGTELGGGYIKRNTMDMLPALNRAYILAGGDSIHKQHVQYISQLYSILEGSKWHGMGKGKGRAGWCRSEHKVGGGDEMQCILSRQASVTLTEVGLWS